MNVFSELIRIRSGRGLFRTSLETSFPGQKTNAGVVGSDYQGSKGFGKYSRRLRDCEPFFGDLGYILHGINISDWSLRSYILNTLTMVNAPHGGVLKVPSTTI